VLAQRNFLNCLEINAKQEFRELSARLLLPHFRLSARFGAQGESDNLALHMPPNDTSFKSGNEVL
jgi:hypothetical protein